MSTPTTTALIPLSELPGTVGATSSSFNSTHAPPDMIKSVWATLELLAPAAPSLFYAPAHFALVSSLNQSVDQQAAFGVQSFLEELTRASFEVATSLLCSSVLAGQSSESDEYGDVGIWVGTLPQRDPWEVLSNLGLKEWIQSKGGKVRLHILGDLYSALISLDRNSRSIPLTATGGFNIDIWISICRSRYTKDTYGCIIYTAQKCGIGFGV